MVSRAEDALYRHKITVLNNAMQEIGMGRYQWGLFFVTGFGYFADNLWPIVTGLILPAVVSEFHFHGPFLKLGQNVGLLVGAAFWGAGADIWGRRISFNITLLIIGVFAVAAGASPNFVVLTSLAAAWSVGVGGNLPVDSSIFLEFVPSTHQYLLTVLSIWWAFGQLIGSLVAWPLISKYSCHVHGVAGGGGASHTPSSCPRKSNMGWRYFLFTMGGLMILMWFIRFFIFTLYESPKYLVGKGEDQRAVDIVREVARRNGVNPQSSVSQLTVEDLRLHSEPKPSSVEDVPTVGRNKESPVLENGSSSSRIQVYEELRLNNIRPLFASRKMALSTSLLISIWALIGLAFPLYNSFVTYYLSTRGAHFGDGSVYITYRNQVILSSIGVPGALLAGYMVELPVLGRRGTLAIATVLTGVFILASTSARTSNTLLAWNCLYSFTSNIMYGVLYAITPELFPTKYRGTGNAITASANRVFGVMAPIIALYANINTSLPVFIAGGVFVFTGILSLWLPYETRGRASV